MSLNNGYITRIVSWNVRGLNHPVKRGKMMAHLKNLKADVMFLQETHIMNTARDKCMGWGSQIYQSNFGTRASVLAIIIKKNVLLDHGCTLRDPNGRFKTILYQGHSTVKLINIYGPNFDNPAFFQTVLGGIPDVGDINIIMEGDFNCIMDAFLDKQSSRSTVNSKSSDELKI